MEMTNGTRNDGNFAGYFERTSGRWMVFTNYINIDQYGSALKATEPILPDFAKDNPSHACTGEARSV